MLDIISYWRNANANRKEVSLHAHEDVYDLSVDEDTEKLGENVARCSCSGKHRGFRRRRTTASYDPATWLLGVCTREKWIHTSPQKLVCECSRKHDSWQPKCRNNPNVRQWKDGSARCALSIQWNVVWSWKELWYWPVLQWGRNLKILCLKKGQPITEDHIRFHFYTVPGTGKSIKIGRRLVIAEGCRRGAGGKGTDC